MFRLLCAGLFAAAILSGCEKKPAPTQFTGKDEHGHDHDRKDAMVVDIELPDGTKCHALLTAHLTTEPGKNELDVFFETTTKDPNAVPIPMKAEVTGVATRPGDDTPHNLVFKPAEMDERKGDPADKSSRYTADAGWMKPDDKLMVVLKVTIDGKLKTATFFDFVPKEKSHSHK